MNVIIIDDELKALKMLEIELQQAFSDINLVGSFQKPQEGIEAINRLKPDLLFLDIEMPKYSGFDVLQQCNYTAMQIIFVTAYSEYALKAIKANALDYILKPIDTDELITAVNKAKRKIEGQNFSDFSKIVQQMTSDEFIKIPSGDELLFLKPQEILYCRAESNYTTIITDKRKILISKTLKHMETVLPKYLFVRVHQSYIVNKSHVRAYTKLDGGYLTLSNGDKVKIAKNKRTLII